MTNDDIPWILYKDQLVEEKDPLDLQWAVDIEMEDLKEDLDLIFEVHSPHKAYWKIRGVFRRYREAEEHEKMHKWLDEYIDTVVSTYSKEHLTLLSINLQDLYRNRHEWLYTEEMKSKHEIACDLCAASFPELLAAFADTVCEQCR
jgi:hypothetical protein